MCRISPFTAPQKKNIQTVWEKDSWLLLCCSTFMSIWLTKTPPNALSTNSYRIQAHTWVGSHSFSTLNTSVELWSHCEHTKIVTVIPNMKSLCQPQQKKTFLLTSVWLSSNSFIWRTETWGHTKIHQCCSFNWNQYDDKWACTLNLSHVENYCQDGIQPFCPFIGRKQIGKIVMIKFWDCLLLYVQVGHHTGLVAVPQQVLQHHPLILLISLCLRSAPQHHHVH